ncbi:hypothetical protein BRADI_0012s00201v3 [Brachypodium distachyon]|uniref:Uncharacterized protein n=1 Tax=Brachypodium distachyon TaxID=15368 RepID=A0A0Q3E586_BRADI|nr:hypothetical protein BRADI_0012s00201v3 [Brachypodium distachyon]
MAGAPRAPLRPAPPGRGIPARASPSPASALELPFPGRPSPSGSLFPARRPYPSRASTSPPPAAPGRRRFSPSPPLLLPLAGAASPRRPLSCCPWSAPVLAPHARPCRRARLPAQLCPFAAERPWLLLARPRAPRAPSSLFRGRLAPPSTTITSPRAPPLFSPRACRLPRELTAGSASPLPPAAKRLQAPCSAPMPSPSLQPPLPPARCCRPACWPSPARTRPEQARLAQAQARSKPSLCAAVCCRCSASSRHAAALRRRPRRPHRFRDEAARLHRLRERLPCRERLCCLREQLLGLRRPRVRLPRPYDYFLYVDYFVYHATPQRVQELPAEQVSR